MKIIIPNYPAPDSFAENVAVTLRAMGHEVRTPEFSDIAVIQYRWSRAVRRIADAAFVNRLTPQEKWLRGVYRQQRPDMLLCLTQAIREDVLEDLVKLGTKCVVWWGDTSANMTKMGLLNDLWHLILLKEKAAVRKFQSVGLNAHLLHEAMNPMWHRKAYATVGESVVVAGNYYGFRQFLLLRLLQAGVPMALYGPQPPRWAHPAVREHHLGAYIVREEKSRIFGEGLACLNSTALSEGDSLNCRAFETAGAAGLQLFEDKPVVADCFEPGKEVLIYRSVEEILELLARARKEPVWASGVREGGWRRAHAEHTYDRRLKTILELL